MRKCDELLKLKRDLIGVEIGVLAGVHAQEMLENLDIKKLYLVDPYISYRASDRLVLRKEMLLAKKEAEERLAEYKNRLVWLVKTSVEANQDIEDESLDFVYIDGCHRYRFVFQDISLWTPKVKKGGLVGGHDWTTQTVREAVEDYCQDNKIKFKQDESDWWFEK